MLRPFLALTLAGAIAVPLTALGSADAAPAAAPAGPAPLFGAVWSVNTAGDTLTEWAPATGSGAANPVATVTGPDTGLAGASAVAVDSEGHVFAANAGNDSITEYAADATGDATPIATIAGSRTGLDQPSSIAVTGGQVWVTAPSDNLVEGFTAGTTGNVWPAATISGAKTKLQHPTLLAMSLFGGVVVANTPAAGAASLESYFPGQSGNIAPDTRIAGSKTGLTTPTAILSSSLTGLLYVTQAGSDAVSEFDSFGFGGTNAAPLGRIKGSNTGLDQPTGLALTPRGGVEVLDGADATLSTFAADAEGNATPQRVLTGVTDAAALAPVAGTPSAPREVHVVSAGHGKVTIAWQPPANDGGGLTGYATDHFAAPKGGGFAFGSGGSRLDHRTRKTFTHLTNGVRYAFDIGAVNAYGETDLQRFVFATPLGPPTAPRAVAVSATNRVVAVAWAAPEHDGGRAIRSYRVQYARCAFGSAGCRPRTVQVTASQRHAQTPVVPAGRYRVRVVAVSSLGASVPSKAASVRVG